MSLSYTFLAASHSVQDIVFGVPGMASTTSDVAQPDDLMGAFGSVNSESGNGDDGTTEAILIITLSILIVAVIFALLYWFLRMRKRASFTSAEKVPLSAPEVRLTLETLLSPPPVITIRELRLLRSEWQSLVADAGGLACLWPEVFLTGALGKRPHDASGTGPGLFYAAALTKCFYQRGISCLGGDDGSVLGEYGTRLLGTAGQLSARAAECKALVVIETAALYDSLTCLQEIYVAQRAGVELILVRFDHDLPDVGKRWAKARSGDAQKEEMVSKVLSVLENLEPIPEKPNTIPDSQAELETVLRAVSAHVTESRHSKNDVQQVGNASKEAKDESVMDDCSRCSSRKSGVLVGSQSLPASGWWGSSARLGSIASSDTPLEPKLHSPIAINVVAASNTATDFQADFQEQEQLSASEGDTSFSAGQEKPRLHVPPSEFNRRSPETQRTLIRFASPTPTDSDAGSCGSRQCESTDKAAPTRKAPVKPKRAKPLRRHDAPRYDIDRYEASREVVDEPIRSSMTDPVHGSARIRRVQTLKLPTRSPQDGTNLKKAKTINAFQRAHTDQVQVGHRSSRRNNVELSPGRSSSPQVANVGHTTSGSEKEASDYTPLSHTDDDDVPSRLEPSDVGQDLGCSAAEVKMSPRRPKNESRSSIARPIISESPCTPRRKGKLKKTNTVLPGKSD